NNLNDRGKIAETISQDFKTCIPDIIFVLDQLEKINTDIDSPFFQKFDLNKLCIMGHSMGGIASLEVLRTDNRCKAGIIIDCFNTYINSVEPIEKPLLFIMGEKGILTEDDPCLKQQLNALQTFCSSSGQCSIFVIPKAGHIAFCDLILLKWPANRLLTWWKLPIGPCDPYNTLKDINNHILTFFDRV
ncbi:MAG TPA: hypothetical protein VFF04_05825, partial [Candidatus Babeliales bacterium]|nr:hypothetical protein [Candidatus Babeliales bacterium]